MKAVSRLEDTASARTARQTREKLDAHFLEILPRPFLQETDDRACEALTRHWQAILARLLRKQTLSGMKSARNDLSAFAQEGSEPWTGTFNPHPDTAETLRGIYSSTV